jgi:hypothetical protein
MTKKLRPSPFWRELAQAVEVQPLEITAIKGTSGEKTKSTKKEGVKHEFRKYNQADIYQ